ncbi:MAG: hypothetical protein ACP5U0_10120 [Caldisphaera sp.]
MEKTQESQVEITTEDMRYLEDFVKYIKSWAKEHSETAKKLEISKKITGFIGEAITFVELKKKYKVKSIWKGGLQKGYDIYIEGKDKIWLNVKTTFSALRERGRGDNKKPDHYEWDVGWSSAHAAKSMKRSLIFVFVDLKELKSEPDLFIIPSAVIEKYFLPHGRQAPKWRRARYHPRVGEIEKYKSNWNILKNRLGQF